VLEENLITVWEEIMSSTTRLQRADVKNLSLADVDAMGQDALKEALKSVIRNPTASMQHQDHRSHSSTSPQRPDEREQMIVAAGNIAAPINKGGKVAPPVSKTLASAPVDKTAH
jgi:hypothetical protein